MSSTADQITKTTHAQAEDATPLRFVTAASLFDGHDAAINFMPGSRFFLSKSGCHS